MSADTPQFELLDAELCADFFEASDLEAFQLVRVQGGYGSHIGVLSKNQVPLGLVELFISEDSPDIMLLGVEVKKGAFGHRYGAKMLSETFEIAEAHRVKVGAESINICAPVTTNRWQKHLSEAAQKLNDQYDHVHLSS